MILTGGDLFEADHRPVYFVAVGSGVDFGVNSRRVFAYPWVLASVIDLPEDPERLGTIMGAGTRLLLDSGAFTLAAAHMRKHGTSMNEALATPPSEIAGFDRLLDRYLGVVQRYRGRLWGHIELDLGTTAMKRETRRYCEDRNVFPIPVYTPLNDGWDYLDELLEEYDRIAVGGLVGMERSMRLGVLTTIWERLRRAPRKVWVHVLGFTPSATFVAMPFDSCDSTQHLASVRYGSVATVGRAMLGNFSALNEDGFSYDRANRRDASSGLPQATALIEWVAECDLRSWQRVRSDLEAEGLDDGLVYPAVVAGERVPMPVGRS